MPPRRGCRLASGPALDAVRAELERHDREISRLVAEAMRVHGPAATAEVMGISRSALYYRLSKGSPRV